MKSILTGILSLIIFFGAVPTANASDMNLANMEEIKKKKKKKKKLGGNKGKKKKKGFFSKVFGSKQMNNPIAKFYQWQVTSGQLDGWTSYHLAAGLFIAKVAQWLGASDFWAEMWVAINGLAWEIFEVYIEGTEETYGTKKKWAYNTGADLFVEIAAAWWMVL